jgi:FlaA1/EpsC-like NDP-sugar epimerase
MSHLKFLGRVNELFEDDIKKHASEIQALVSESSFLVLGGAGSIGQAVVKEIFSRNPIKLHVVDISENNLVELVRDVRSSYGYINGDFQTFALDIGSWQYDVFIKDDGIYDYVLNLSALKHVRSEKDAYTLMRMVEVNILNTEKTIKQSIEKGTKKYFCVSTDKAANPVNMMGCSKRIMELVLMEYSKEIDISTARFANVAFSDGSLLHGFDQRIMKRQPIVAPKDIKRYFVTPKESGELCLMSCIFGQNRDIFFPKLSESLDLLTFSEIAERYLESKGFEVYECNTETEARELAMSLPDEGKWPCLFVESDTTGEKDFEEFFTDLEILDMERFENLGIIKNELVLDQSRLALFRDAIREMREIGTWQKEDLISLFNEVIPNFGHQEKGKYLDSKM